MRYTVVWRAEALADLAQFWAIAKDRQAVADAADQIDKSLSTDPERKGMLESTCRVLVVPPLAVAFDVFPDDCLVRVQRIVRVK